MKLHHDEVTRPIFQEVFLLKLETTSNKRNGIRYRAVYKKLIQFNTGSIITRKVKVRSISLLRRRVVYARE